VSVVVSSADCPAAVNCPNFNYVKLADAQTTGISPAFSQRIKNTFTCE
jgi:hypothetical protein